MRLHNLLNRQRLQFAACLIILCTPCRARQPSPAPSGLSYRDEFTLRAKDSVVSLQHEFVIPGTETLLLDSTRLRGGIDYSLNGRTGAVTIHRLATLFAGSGPSARHRLTVSYQALPFSFRRVYAHREMVVAHDSTGRGGGSLTGSPGGLPPGSPPSPSLLDGIFGSNLQKNGSIVRGLTVGSNRDLSLTSGFRMQMSGSLTRDLDVVAALTDENSPIQPEGTTRTLQEVDKVFVELRGNNLSATLGDFNLGITGNEFGGVNRKLQGVKGVGTFRGGATEGDVMLTGAVARGKFTTNQFQGLDGVQGPYRLSGQNNERDILVIAGTERVYVNGERMTRGDINDYVIDYAVGEVSFTPGRFISRASRVVVDFEYTDRQFSRAFVAAKSGVSFFDRRVTFGAEYLAENDNEDSPVDVTLGDSDKTILRAAGNDRLKAARPGVEIAGPGKGQYIRKDTVVITAAGTDSSLAIYRFAPEDSLNAIYRVTFSYVGAGNGEYAPVSSGRYQFVGLRQGNYSPIRFLPVPSAHRLADFDIGARLSDQLTIGGEYAVSDFDANRFSSIGDENNIGPAAKFNLEFNPKNLRLGGRDLGSLDLQLRERFVDRRYVSPDRVNEIEFNRKWNIVDSSKLDEELREGSLIYQPVPGLSLGGGLGWMKRGDPFLSRRTTGSVNLGGGNSPNVRYDLEVIGSRDEALDDRSDWTRHRGLAEYSLGKFTPGIEYDGEVLRSFSLASGTLKPASVRFSEISPRVRIDSVGGMSFRAEFGWRSEDSLHSGSLTPASTSLIQRYGWQLEEWHSFSSSLDVTLQNKTPREEFRRPNQDDVRNALVRSQSRFNPLGRGIESDFLYEIATEQSTKLERLYQQVQKGSGNYVYLGDVNGNHLMDDPDFRLARFDGDFISVTVPTDNLIPVIDLKASTRLRFSGSRLFTSQDWYGRLLGALSSETYARVDEKSSESDKKQIYLLHFSRFLNNKTTIAGSNLFSQDLYILENRPDFSLRLRYSQRRGLTEYDLAEENTLSDERSVRVRWQLVKEFSNQTDLIQRKDILTAAQGDYRVRSILSRSLESDWTYRPQQSLEMGIKMTVGESADFDTSRADLNTESVRTVYSFSERGQARVEFTREEVTLNKVRGFIPFELTGGRAGGRSWMWHVGLDYRLTQFVQSTIMYDGRSEGGGSPVHTAKAEVRAFF